MFRPLNVVYKILITYKNLSVQQEYIIAYNCGFFTNKINLKLAVMIE